uniref:Sulfotransferase domain-containing protein n=2 Tax=Arion vulgaris TaxID=1028688 RepID=A0A0B7A1Z4_9EUPU
MSHWRMNYFRCSPRSGFYAIIVCVSFTFVLTTYLYSGSRHDYVDTTKEDRNYNHQDLQQRQQRRQHVNLSLRHHGHHHGTERQGDRFGNTWNRHKNLHRRKEQQEEDWQQLSTPKMKQVFDVINLMSKSRSSNETSTLGNQKQILIRQVKLLRDAMTSQQTMLTKPPKLPECVGDIQPGEVEDLFCIPRPKFLSHIKNPCWYSSNSLDQADQSLHCLPYFHILGCAKSGTTDLWNRLMSHPHTVSNDGLLHKEALWWSWYRYGVTGYNRHKRVQNFTNYVSLFQDTARQIQSSIEKETLSHQILITGDASPPDFWDFRGWSNISQNRHLDVPAVITPHLMRHIYANPKFIIMFRDPIDRLYSDYFFVGLGLTAQDFHNDIVASVDMLAKCVEQQGLHRCFHDHDMYVKLPVRLPYACYSVFMREWLQVFPLENFLFLKTEEYEKNLEDTLKSVMEFLGLGPLKATQLQVIAEEERSRVTVQRQIAGPMKNATRIILEELLGACNTELVKLIKSDKFLWSST